MCNTSSVLSVFLIIKILLEILWIVVPILVIFRASVICFQAVISGKNISEYLPMLFKSVISGLIVFVLPVFLNFIFSFDDSEIGICFENASLINVNELRNKEANDKKDKLKDENESLSESIKKQQEEVKKRNEAILKDREEREKLKEQEESKTSNFKQATNNIIIGDSRTVGMCTTITGKGIECSLSNGGPLYNNEDIYVAQSSMSYSWFSTTALSTVNTIISNNPDTTYNIYSLMGVNLLLSDINKYITLYNRLATNEWKNHNIILVSVNPVDEAVEARYGYSTKNSDIVTFNNKLYTGTLNNSNVKYCDTFNMVKNNLSTTDGLHYNSSTYNAIYSGMKSCVK